jgi:hypothetical protein
MDELITGSDSAGYTTLGFSSFPFFECSTLYDRGQLQGVQWGVSNLMPLLNDGPHIVNHLGHSNVTYNMRLMNHNVDELINVHPFLHYSQGCYNGAFDNCGGPEAGNAVYNQDCIAEHLVAEPHGAFATISNSRYGWGSSMTDGPSQRFHRQFWDAFFGEGLSTIGQALIDSKEDNASAFADPYIRWVGFENNLLGDPAITLKKSLNTTDPLLGIYPPQLDFIAILGEGAPDSASMRVLNDGVGSLAFTAGVDQSWVTLTPDSGDAPVEISVQVDPTGLQPGTHQAVITFESAEAANSPMEMTIEFTLVEVPEIVVPHVTQAPVLDGVIGTGEYDAALQLAIDPNAAGDVMLYLAVAGTQLFVGVDDRLDTAAADWDRMMLYFDLDLDGFWPSASADEGAYIVIARGGGGLIFVPFYNPGGGVQMDFRNMDRDPAGAVGVIGFVDNHRVYEMSLDLETANLDVGPAGAFGMYLEVQNSEQMGGGTMTGSWPLVVPEIDDQMYFGRVDLTPQEAWLHASPGSIYFEAITERAAPAPGSITVSELLGGEVSFTASPSVSWLQVAPASGQTPQDLTVTADQTGLQPGTHAGEIVLASTETGNGQHSVPVTFEVLPLPARLSVDPASLDVIVAAGDLDPQVSLTIENLGGREMPVTLTPSETWVGTTESFSVPPGGSQTVVVQLALSGLAQGTHSAEILAAAPQAENSPVTVPVQLEIQRANTAPPAPILLSPADGSELYGPIDLMAYPVVDPEGDPVTYRFELLTSAGGDPVDSGAGVENVGFVSWQPTARLDEKVRYYWRVKATDDRDAAGEYSEEWTFTFVKKPGSEDCGCAHSRSPSLGFLFFLIGLAALRFSGRRR